MILVWPLATPGWAVDMSVCSSTPLSFTTLYLPTTYLVFKKVGFASSTKQIIIPLLFTSLSLLHVSFKTWSS